MKDDIGDDFDGIVDQQVAGIINTPKGSGFSDPSGVYPLPEYHYRSSVNKVATGHGVTGLSVGGGDPRIDAWGALSDATTDQPGKYTHVDINETKSGHQIVYDDTPGNERILIKHRTGAGVELRADGTMILKTESNMITAVSGNSSIIIEGDIQMAAKNFNLNVAADMNLKVGGDFNVTVGGSLTENINGSRRETIQGQAGTTVKGSKSTTVLGTVTNTTLGSHNNIVKGNSSNVTEGSASHSAKGAMKVSSEAETNMSSPSVNIAGNSLSVFGATGTIGGEGIIAYVKNIYGESGTFTEGFKAPTFEGKLKGKADDACKADYATTAGQAPLGIAGSPSSQSHTAVDTAATEKPTSSLLSTYLNKSSRGVSRISIDAGDHLKNMIDKSVKTGGVTDRPLTEGETRIRMLDEDNAANADFVAHSVASGTLAPTYSNSVPPAVGRTRSTQPHGRSGTSFNPGGTAQSTIKSFLPAEKPPAKVFSADPAYDPMNLDPKLGPTGINSSTMLAKGVPLGTFLGGTADAVTLNHIATLEERQAIARNLLPQAEIIKYVQNNKGEFKDYRLVVVSGLYKLSPNETKTTNSDKDLATKGRRVIYELYGPNGKPAPDKIYELADYLTDVIYFDKMMLSYDNFNPAGAMVALLSVTMPELSKTYTIAGGGNFKNLLETRYNGKVQSANDLIEVLPQ